MANIQIRLSMRALVFCMLGLIIPFAVSDKQVCDIVPVYTYVAKCEPDTNFNLSNSFATGIDNAGERMTGDFSGHLSPTQVKSWWKGLDILGSEFVVYHSWYNAWPLRDREFQIDNAENLSTRMKNYEMHFLLNLEIANWRSAKVDKAGHNWVKRPNGAHGFTFHPDVLSVFIESPMFEGVVYDEPGHMLINRHITAGATVEGGPRTGQGDYPLFVETTGSKTIEEAYEAFLQAATVYVQELRDAGVRYVASETVFPIIHPFAEAGFTPAPKILKESWMPVIMAMGIGAALQYDRELWICVDLWDATAKQKYSDPLRFPGHNPLKLRSALRFAYHMGADRVYVENYNFRDSLVILDPECVKLTSHGSEVAAFTNNYLPNHKRNYSFRDIRPEVAIIRMEDTNFGLHINPDWPAHPYGAKNLKHCSRTANWMKAWHILTHGVIPYTALDWNAGGIYHYSKIGRHILFAPLNNVVVFDHKVEAQHLKNLKLAFLCGLAVSEGTRTALEELVSNGLIVIADPCLVNSRLQAQYTGPVTIVQEGEGYWVLAENFLDEKVKQYATPFLGPENHIRYVFGSTEVTFQGKVNTDTIDVAVSTKLSLQE